jgi:hypothetical protein
MKINKNDPNIKYMRNLYCKAILKHRKKSYILKLFINNMNSKNSRMKLGEIIYIEKLLKDINEAENSKIILLNELLELYMKN